MDNKIKDTQYHSDWQKNRIKFILERYPKEFFKGKKILELAPFNGYIGSFFQSLGAEVTMVEGRQENIDNIKRDYPQIENIFQKNLDTKDWDLGNFDIIINFGLLYHLQNFHKEHLKNCLDNCNLMFFETVVFDSDLPEIYFRAESGKDQSLTSIGGNPSTSWLHNLFDDYGCEYTKYSSPELNGGVHRYDWEDKNTRKLSCAARRFWIIE